MRILMIFAGIAAVMAVLYKWRYRLLIMFSTFCMLGKTTTIIKTNMPIIKEKILPKLFRKQETAAEN